MDTDDNVGGCCERLGIFYVEQLKLMANELPEELARKLHPLLDTKKADGALLWRQLSALMDDAAGRRAVMLTASGLVPAVLQQLSDADSDALLPSLADTIRHLPQLTSCVEALLGRLPAPPWPPVTAGAQRPAKRRRREPASARHVLTSLLPLVASFTEAVRWRWDWSDVFGLLRHDDAETRWLCARIVALMCGMGAAQTAALVSACDVATTDDISWSTRHLGQSPVTWSAADDRPPPADHDVTASAPLLTSEDIGGTLVCVEGVTLAVVDAQAVRAGPLVAVPETRAALRRLALAAAAGRPALLQGPVGSGKTCLVRHLADITGHVGWPRLITVQLGDQTDSKLLLGTYRCTEVPGELIWQPGCLTQAVTEGHWLLLEDVDHAPMDVVSLLVPLLESRQLTVPSHGDVLRAAPGFQLFATQRLLPGAGRLHKQQVSHSSLLDRLWLRIAVQPLPADQLRGVIAHKWPRLATVADRLLEVYRVMTSPPDATSLHTKQARMVSTRDLMKWCQRVGEEFDVTSSRCASVMFQDAVDIFCAAVANKELRLPLAQEIGSRLSLLSAQVEFSINSHKPAVSICRQRVSVGRASLTVMPAGSTVTVTRPTAQFSFTRPSCVLLERVGVAVSCREPVLLVGETGVGKTCSVQYLAEQTGHRLVVINMNQQSDSSDLLGGYKPVDIKHIMAPLREEFETLFKDTFDATANEKFLRNIMTVFAAGRWRDMTALMRHVHGQATARLARRCSPSDDQLRRGWTALGVRLERLRRRPDQQLALAFAFIEGTLVKALREGCWVLLDEINLASAETLECLSGLLESAVSGITLLERGDVQTIDRHPDFQLFACMNPATDVGKRDLPAGLRNRFTEVFVDELEEESDLRVLAADYLRHLGVTSAQVNGVVQFYQRIRREAAERLVDGTGHRPHYSLRTLCRALRVAAQNPCGGVLRSLYEALCFSFLTQLDRPSYPAVTGLIESLVLGGRRAGLLQQPIPPPAAKGYLQFEGYWVRQGTAQPEPPDHYVLTASVRENLRDLARAVSLGGQPVLLQGDTSVGKTSLIAYLAAASGNRCVRINNHEHTDLQEYVGAYGADVSGRLVFQEGALVEAMRRGHWVILDELNLAPSDVLEALNRVLDDNRELFIAETQTVVRAHPRFMLFATQNPPGLYGGRKMLSRAFRNRFVELHFDEIPPAELETILHERCHIPSSYCKKMVSVLLELQVRRRGSSVFQGKQGFITLRDLFRWAERYRQADDQTTRFYDWDQHVADEGYLVLAGRVRKQDECQVIAAVLQKHFKRTVDDQNLFSLHEKTSPVTRPVLEQLLSGQSDQLGFQHLVWTFSARRLAVLLCQALRFQEPALLVGETGCGKTTVCQLLSAAAGRRLHTVNCHMHTEGADFLGGLRPVRDRQGDTGRLFEWVDGPLVEAMRHGDYFLSDEISLADDSVLERLNSVLEPERTLLLAEKSGADGSDLVVAQQTFRFVATMNPGGDYGKKELSPALRNRFTEIWCPAAPCRRDLVAIISHNLRHSAQELAGRMMDFVEWYAASDVGKRTTVNIRDILTWVNFVNTTADGGVSVPQAYLHGACLVFLDRLGCGQSTTPSASLRSARDDCLRFLEVQMVDWRGTSATIASSCTPINTDAEFGFAPFVIAKGSDMPAASLEGVFSMEAPTPAENARRVLRALQLAKPVLLEGSPGVGKTSLVAALARATGHTLTRINLSDQTDVSDLFGADLPEEGGQAGHFTWRDGPLLQALKAGHWVVLDELNLACQSVLEGLNACLDHRGSVFVPELGREFQLRPGVTRIFACQNPLHQGGARKGLPKSFLNRFTQVYVEPLTPTDLERIVLFTALPDGGLGPGPDDVRQMAEFSRLLNQSVHERRELGQRGGPWEFNLRDLTRWCQLLAADGEHQQAIRHVQLLYADRMRSASDKAAVLRLSEQVFDEQYARPPCHLSVTREALCVGGALMERTAGHCHVASLAGLDMQIIRGQLPIMESLMTCLNMNWMAILVGPAESGKTSLVNTLAALTGHRLRLLTVNSAMDTTELLGGFEQADLRRHLEEIIQELEDMTWAEIRSCLLAVTLASSDERCRDVTSLWEEVKRATAPGAGYTTTEEADRFVAACDAAERLLERLGGERADQLRSRVAQLRATTSRDRTVNAGGRFEWVDSVLVKALRAGDWLLVDNVNLCAASVLDRLNGLLEPAGLLELSERGVVAGAVPTVTPHRNFRLVLAMDPRHGEISRAMRNRGVELYMLGPEEGGSLSQPDVSCLLASRHLTEPRLQSIVRQLHTASRQLVTGAERPGLLDLLRCSDLASQMMGRGSSASQALTEAAMDTYVRPLMSAELGRRLTPILSDIIAGGPAPGRDALCAAAAGAGVRLHLADADLARVVRLWPAVRRHLPALSADQRCAVVRSYRHVAAAASRRGLHYVTMAAAHSADDCLARLAGVDAATVLGAGESPLAPGAASPARMLALHLRLEAALFEESDAALLRRMEVERSWKEATMYGLSLALEKDLVSLRALPHPSVQLLAPLLRQLDVALRQALESEAAPAELAARLLAGAGWRRRLRALCDRRPTSSGLDDWLSLLALHWRWTADRLLTALPSTCRQSGESELRQLHLRLDALLAAEVSRPVLFAAEVTEGVARPRPFSQPETAGLACDLIRVSCALDPYLPVRPADGGRLDVADRLKLPDLLGETQLLQLRKQLTDVITDILLRDHYTEQAEEALQTALSLLGGRRLLPTGTAVEALPPTPPTPPTPPPQDDVEPAPLAGPGVPLLESLLRRKEAPLAAAVVAGLSEPSASGFAADLATFSIRAPLYVALWRAAVHPDPDPQLRDTLRQSLLTAYLQMAAADPDHPRWLPVEEREQQQQQEPQHVNPWLYSAELTYVITTDLCRPEADSLLDSVTVGAVPERRRQMSTLRRLVAANATQLADARFCLRRCHSLLVQASWRPFWAALLAAAKPADCDPATPGDVIAALTESGCVSKEQAVWLTGSAAAVDSVTDHPADIGRTFVYVGASQMAVLGQLMAVDPVEERKILLEYCRDELADAQCDLAAADTAMQLLSGVRLTDLQPQHVPAALSQQQAHVEALRVEAHRLDVGVACRPTPPLYQQLKKEVRSFLSSVAGVSALTTLADSAACLLAADGSPQPAALASLAAQLRSRLASYASFLSALQGRYGWYRDVVGPLLTAGRQVEFGLRVLLHHAQLRSAQLHLPPLLRPLQPVVVGLASWLRPRAIRLGCPVLGALLGTLRRPDRPHLVAEWKLRLLMLVSQELSAQLTLTGDVGIGDVSQLMCEARQLWTAQEKRRQEQQQQQDSLYKTRTHCEVNDTDEEAETGRQLQQMFPDYSGAFSDLSSADLESQPAADTSATERPPPELTADMLAELWQLHRRAYQCCAAARWLPERPPEDAAPDLIRPFCQRYRLLAALSEQLSTQLDSSTDAELADAHLMAAAIIDGSTEPEVSALAPPPPQKPYDVYRDPHVTEVASCRDVLQRLDGRCDELLSQWPDHPAVVQLRRVIARVLSLAVTTPLVKVVTGLELVLERAQDWEQNAHTGVSLSTQLEEITELVLRWRKLELDCWKRCLDSAAYTVHMSAARWLPHLCGLLEEQLSAAAPLRQSTQLLQRFIESSPLGEFPARLDMLLSAHRQMVAEGSPATGRKGALCSMLWNLYQYYNQFYPSVENHLKALRKPVEQKVKDFVKIARWNDVNFWSVKDSVKKSHRMVHKHVKEFQAILAQPVSAALLDPDVVDEECSREVGAWDQSAAAAITITPELYIARGRPPPTECPYPDHGRLDRLRRLYLRSRRLCRTVYTHSRLMDDVTSLNDVTACVCQTVDELSKLNVDGIVDKDKRRKEVGHMKQRKRKAVVELYHMLSRMGVSYRRGLISWDQGSSVCRLLVMPPVDVTGGDGRISAAWRGCLKYECRAMSRMALLQRALLQPHRELGPQNIDRMRGYSADLMAALAAARLSLTQVEEQVSCVSTLLQEVTAISCPGGAAPDHSASRRRYRVTETHLMRVSESYLTLLSRVRLLVLAVPAGQSSQLDSLRLSPAAGDGVEPAGLLADVEAATARTRAARRRLRRAGGRRWCHHALLYTRDDSSRLEEARAELGQAATAFARLRLQLSAANTGWGPLSTALRDAEMQLEEAPEPHVGPLTPPPPPADPESQFVLRAVRLSTRVLLAVQGLHALVEPAGGDDADDDDGDGDGSLAGPDGLLSDRLHQKLICAARRLGAAGVLFDLASMVRLLAEADLTDEQARRMITLLSHMAPLLHQYQHLCTFVLVHQMAAYRSMAKLLCVLLKVFATMAQKGFCTPEDLQDEGNDSEAGTQFKDIEDGGLGEGQGAKDVSDKLESEDQLEGAYKPGEEPEDADDDLKEEDQGVEMSEDFGGKMQDVDRKEDQEENDDSGDEEEEPEKQMGDVDAEDQERVDEKLWGSDDEEEEQPAADDEDGDGGRGREDSRLAAKDDQQDDADEPSEQERKQERQRQEMKENEMEDDEDQQADPYHNNFAADADPEEMDVPERAGDDSEHGSDSDSEQQEPQDNPWDIEQCADFPDGEEPQDQEQDVDEPQPPPQDAAPEEEEGGESDDEGETREEQKTSDERANEEDPSREEPMDVQEQEPARLDASEEAVQAAQDSAARGTQDRLDRPQQVAAEERPDEAANEADRADDKYGVGMAESSRSGHQAADRSHVSRLEQRQEAEQRVEQRRPGCSDSKRSLGADGAPFEKRLKTVDADRDEERAEGEPDQPPAAADVYQHVQQAEQRHDALTTDAATREQAEERPVASREDEDAPPADDEDVQMAEEPEDELPDRLEPVRPDRLSERRRDAEKEDGTGVSDQAAGPERGDVDGDQVTTLSAQRPVHSSAHTSAAAGDDAAGRPDALDVDALRRHLESCLDFWHEESTGMGEHEAELAWQKYETVIGPLAQDLCEQLRLILEPTQKAKLMGDYRTGKRLNMRKVIPYIASQFRKDKIWLRRTKPSKRDYRVVVAVDDSSSMADNQSRQLAFESLALVSRALALLEVGQLAVLSFGEQTRLLHGLHEPLGAAAGAELLRRFTFAQAQTRVAAMLDGVTALLADTPASSATAQLLLVVSDGRGIFYEGREPVRCAIRRARHAGLFVVFIVVDSPLNKDSILDIRMPQFGPGGRLLGIRSYMDEFPFPFYLILRDIEQLPAVLSDALRQWFELVTAGDR